MREGSMTSHPTYTRPHVSFDGQRMALVFFIIWSCLWLLHTGPVIAATPSVDEILNELHFSDGDKQSIREGDIIDWSPREGSDRELALGMVFMVKEKPDNLAELFREAAVLREVSVITAHGQLTAEGTMKDLAGVALT